MWVALPFGMVPALALTPRLPWHPAAALCDWLPPIQLAELGAMRARFRHLGFSAGSPGGVRLSGSRLGVLVCYEDLFSQSACARVRQGARALVDLTNDRRLGDTRAPRLHELTTRQRSVELRGNLVRAVSTGVSSFTTATVASLVRTPVFAQARFVAAVRLLD